MIQTGVTMFESGQHMTGDTAGAIETEKKALALLPADSPARGYYEAAIARFKAAMDGAQLLRRGLLLAYCG